MTRATTAAEMQVGSLLRGEYDTLRAWMEHWSGGRTLFHLAVIVLGSGCYGAAMGAWRDPVQALFVALKFPVIILLTTCGNALLNGMLAPLLGANLGFRQSFLAILMSFTIAGSVLGACSPLVAFLVWNAPPMTPGMSGADPTYAVIRLTHVGVIAFAGVAGNVRLAQLLRAMTGSRGVTNRVVCAWLAANLFLGSQLSWILRPFIGSPVLPVEFLRPNAFEGNFYETVSRALSEVLTGD